MSKHLHYCKDLPNLTPPNSLRLVLKTFLLAFILLLASSPVWAVYYVKPTGSDRSSCTAIQADPGNTPARSIQRALDCIAKAGSGAGKEVRIYAGSYVTFSIPAAASGSATGGYLLIRANPGDTVNVANTTAQTVISADLTPTSYIQVEGLSFSGTGFQGMSLNFGNNIRILNNIVTNTQTCIAVGNTTNLEISGNWLHHCANNIDSVSEGHGISLTGNSTDILIDNNLIEDVGNSDGGYGLFLYGLSTGSRLARITVSNNVLRRNAAYGIGCMGVSGDYCKIYNNVVNNNATGGILISAVTNPLIYNNTIYGNIGTSIEYEYSSNTAIRNNIFYQNSRNAPAERTRRTNSGTIINTNLTGTNPSFVDATNGDFHIQSESAARNAGVDLSSVFTTDIVGTIRPQGTPWDIGAYAFVASGNTTPTTVTLTSATSSPTYSTTSSTVNTSVTVSSSATSASNTVSATVSTPTITPNGALFNGSVLVSLADSTPKATIYYTTNGSSPTQSSQKYTGPFSLSSSTLVKAKAFKNNFEPSAEASAWFSAASPAVSPSGLMAYWKFDEGSGTSVADSSGNGNIGTLVNGPLWTAGKAGNALYFDGIDDNVTVLDSASLHLSSAFTLSAWVNPAATFTDYRAIVTKNPPYYLYASSIQWVCPAGSPLGGFSTDVLGINPVCQPSPLPTNTWTHLAVTYNGSTLTLYRNGVAVANSNVSATLSPTTLNLQIGGSQFGEYFKGLIDEVRIYNRSLTATEIQATYQQESVETSQTVATPVISPSGGNYSGSVSVTMQTATSGASIYYTTNGSTPTQSSTLYSGPMTLANSATVKTKAFKSGSNPSAEASASLTVTQPFSFSLASSGNISVLAGSSVTNSISTTLVSGSAQAVTFLASGLPTGATASFSSTSCSPACSSTLTINTNGSTPAGSSTITVTASGGGLTKTTTFSLNVSLQTVATPTISPSGGNYSGSVSVTMQTATSGASIYYTTNGSTPTQSSTPYSGPMTLANSATVKTKAFKSGSNPSAEAGASFTVAPSNLVAHWKFDEGSGTSVADSSGNGNIGTLVNGPLWTAGKAGNALYFDGIDDNVTVLDSASLHLSSAFTLSAWVNPAATFTDYRAIVTKNPPYYLYASSIQWVCPAGSPLGGFSTDVLGINPVCQPSPLPTNTWTHLAVTYNGSTLTLYRNGVAVANSNVSATLSPTTLNLQIGGSQFGEYFKGLIDEVRIYNRSLTATEIQATYQQESVETSQTVATPVISPSGGNYSGSVSVTMQTATSGASIYYTTNGSTPTQSSTPYSGPMTLTNSATVKTKAFKSGSNPSAEASASLTVTQPFSFSLASSGNISVLAGSSVTNSISTTLVSGSAQAVTFLASGLPTGATASFSSTSCSPACSSTLTINTNGSTPAGSSTITVTASGGGLTKTTTFSLNVSLQTVATPTISPSGGNYSGSVSVTMQTATSGASIYYTTNGSTPTQSSTPYSGPMTLANSATVKTKAFKSGSNPSAEAGASFTVAPSNLVAHWKFDEGSGTSVADSSGNGNIGTLVNGPLWTAGKAGNALYFDGIDDNVTVLDSASLHLSSAFTLSAWVNPAATFTDYRAIVTKNPPYYLYASSIQWVCPAGSPLGGFSTDVLGINPVCQPSPLPTNTWTHLAVTYNGSTLTLYRNGVAVANSNVSATLSPTTLNLQIGGSQFGEYFKGLIDEVRIYNRSLTATEIQATYQQESVETSQTVATPVISPSGGNYSGSVSVTMQTATSGASIYYTTNGSTPTQSSTPYSGPMTLTNSATVKTKAFKSGSNPSAEASASLTVTQPFSFSLASSGNISVLAGSSVTNSISTTLVSGSAQAVTFLASGLPTGATASFSSTSCSPACSSTLTINTNGSTPAGSSTITVTASGGGLTKTTTFSLNVSLQTVATPTTAGTTWYVKTPANGGNNSNPCTGAGGNNATNPNFAKATITGSGGALSCIGGTSANGAGAGHTVEIWAGTYTEQINDLPGGTGWAANQVFTLKAHGSTVPTLGNYGPNGDDVVIQGVGANGILSVGTFTGGVNYNAYILVQGIHFRGGGGMPNGAPGPQVQANREARQIHFYGNRISNSTGQFGSGMHQSEWKYNLFDNQLVGTWTSHGQSFLYAGYMFYWGSSDGLIEGNRFTGFPYIAIHMYSADEMPSRNIIRYNQFDNWGWGPDTPGDTTPGSGLPPEKGGSAILISGGGSNNEVYGNVIRDPRQNSTNNADHVGMAIFSTSNTLIYNNTITQITLGQGLAISNDSGSNIYRNNIFSGNKRTMVFNGATPTLSRNLCSSNATGCDSALTEPSTTTFINAANDFHLKSGSKAIGVATVPLPDADLTGLARQGTFDIGAYDYRGF